MTIKGISDRLRLPCCGKIRLGLKKKSAKGVEFPTEVDYFVIKPEEEYTAANGEIKTRINPDLEGLREMLGETPNEMSIVFPVDQDDMFNSQYLLWFTKSKNKRGQSVSKLMCRGDGEYAQYFGDRQIAGLNPQNPPQGMNRMCNLDMCPQRQEDDRGRVACSPTLLLSFIVPKYSNYKVFQISSKSLNAMMSINSCLSVARNALGIEGLRSMVGVPMRLTRKAKDNGRGGVNYPLHLEVDTQQLVIEKANYLESKASTLMLGNSDVHIEFPKLPEPDYDLMPKSEYPDRLQTGDPIETKALPVSHDYDGWLKDAKVVELFNNLAEKANVPLTNAKMMATARNQSSLGGLVAYLEQKMGD